MAAAEARAVLQRTANRCFIQEDARRAPKISAPSSSSSKSQSDARTISPTNGSDHPTPRGMAHILNPDVQSDTKWWLHLQPNFAYRKDFIYEQLNSLESELEGMSGNQKPVQESDANTGTSAGFFSDQPLKVSAACFKRDQDSRVQELKAVSSNNNPKKSPKEKEMEEFWCPEDCLMDLDPFTNSVVSKQPNKVPSDLESDWMGVTRNEPWWRTTDKYELASLVAQKSNEHIENCDLPRPQTKHFKWGQSASPERSVHDGILSSSLDEMPVMGFAGICNTRGSLTSAHISEKLSTLADVGQSPKTLDKSFSSKSDCSTRNEVDNAGMHSTIDDGPSKAQLLEALCHSQTRARQAEEAAQQAYSEKEHIIKLFFKQASQLFAYKQWLQLLQLENLCLQLRNKNPPISTLLPDAIPWGPHKGGQPKKGRLKGEKRKQNPPMCELTKCAIAFAVGLSLAGAGLLLGWTMGWLLPSF